MINTNNIINTIKTDIQKSIDLEQKKLDSISNAFEKAQQFLLDNGYSEINEDDDVLTNIMKCIKLMKEQIKTNEEDIGSINKSIKSLEGLSNSIETSIIENLSNKIKIIKGYNDTSDEKLKESKAFLETLLSLEIICPVCGGKIKTTHVNNSTANAKCSYCEGTGVVNISKVLEKESLLEVDYVKTKVSERAEFEYTYQNYSTNNSNSSINTSANTNTNTNTNEKEEKTSNKFVIRKS